jgi:tetratricopeptide (TPR) repeat protein
MIEREPYRPGLVRNEKLVKQLKELQKNPRSLVFVSLAEQYRSEGLPLQALEILDEGLAYHPGLASAVLSRARCLFALRRFAEASVVCREILQANPENIKAYRLQADIFVRLGQRKAAIRALTKVVSLYPQDMSAVKALEELENLESRVIVPPERLSRASTDSPPSAPGRISDFQVGSFRDSFAAISQKAPEAAPEVVEMVDAEEPVLGAEPVGEAELAEPTFATRTIAELYLRQGLKRKAAKVLRKILEEEPDNAWARETLQDLGSDGIVLPAQRPQIAKQRSALTQRAKMLERMLAQVRLRRTRGA